MAFSATTIVEVRLSGSDTLNGGTFDPGVTLTADGAATSATGTAPVFSSASYTFVAGDVGAWLFIKSGTNWTPGWYPIASVAGGAATLNAAIGAAILYSSVAQGGTGYNTVAGCATTASPTSASWTVDYSQQNSVQTSLTGLTTAGVAALISTASATKAMLGNGLQITGGTNFTTGFYTITAAVAATSITVDRNCSSGAGASGTAGMGGALATPGQAGAINTVVGMRAMVFYAASAYIATSASTNIAAGCVLGTSGTYWCGYYTSRWLYNSDSNRPTFQINTALSAATLFTGTNNAYFLINFILDGQSNTTSRGVFMSGVTARVWAKNFTNAAIKVNSGGYAYFCEVSGCSTINPVQVTLAAYCEFHDNTISPVSGGNMVGCISYNNSGAGVHGFSAIVEAHNCVAYNNGGAGFNPLNNDSQLFNCISESNATWGYFQNTVTMVLFNCASYNNTSGRASGGFPRSDIGAITGSGSFFTNAASSIFTLNNTAGAGALARAAGFPATFPAGLTANYLDVGAVQHLDSGGGTTVVIGRTVTRNLASDDDPDALPPVQRRTAFIPIFTPIVLRRGPQPSTEEEEPPPRRRTDVVIQSQIVVNKITNNYFLVEEF